MMISLTSAALCFSSFLQHDTQLQYCFFFLVKLSEILLDDINTIQIQLEFSIGYGSSRLYCSCTLFVMTHACNFVALKLEFVSVYCLTVFFFSESPNDLLFCEKTERSSNFCLQPMLPLLLLATLIPFVASDLQDDKEAWKQLNRNSGNSLCCPPTWVGDICNAN